MEYVLAFTINLRQMQANIHTWSIRVVVVWWFITLSSLDQREGPTGVFSPPVRKEKPPIKRTCRVIYPETNN